MGYPYDVAISYAGPEREYAGAIARIAVANHLNVFYDEFYVSEMWGRNLVESLTDIYENQARYCVIIVSRDYCERPYTRVERRVALDRAIASKMEYILPVVTDDAWPEGLPRSTAYLDLRKMSVGQVAESLVRKVKGDGHVRVEMPDDSESNKVIALPKGEGGSSKGNVEFALIRLGDEVPNWTERDVHHVAPEGFSDTDQAFVGPLNGDPLFDVTIMNRTGEPVLLTAVGIEFVIVDEKEYPMGGAFAGEEILRSQTFYLEVPDLWAALAQATREAGGRLSGPLDVRARAMSRLPNPVLLDADRPYRYGLELFDYQRLIPNRAKLRFWVRTDAGEQRSGPVYVEYLIPGHYGGITRFVRLVDGLEEDGSDSAGTELRKRPI